MGQNTSGVTTALSWVSARMAREFLQRAGDDPVNDPVADQAAAKVLGNNLQKFDPLGRRQHRSGFGDRKQLVIGQATG